jgi:hypothetical protein
MKFRKKPVVIDAWPISSLLDDWTQLRMMPKEVVDALADGTLKFGSGGLYVQTLEGGMFGRHEDILIRGTAGEFYPCKPEIFAATYEKAG